MNIQNTLGAKGSQAPRATFNALLQQAPKGKNFTEILHEVGFIPSAPIGLMDEAGAAVKTPDLNSGDLSFVEKSEEGCALPAKKMRPSLDSVCTAGSSNVSAGDTQRGGGQDISMPTQFTAPVSQAVERQAFAGGSELNPIGKSGLALSSAAAASGYSVLPSSLVALQGHGDIGRGVGALREGSARKVLPASVVGQSLSSMPLQNAPRDLPMQKMSVAVENPVDGGTFSKNSSASSFITNESWPVTKEPLFGEFGKFDISTVIQQAGASSIKPQPLQFEIKAPVASPNFPSEVQKVITQVAFNGGGQAEIKMHPEHLGPVQLTVTVKENSVTTNFVVNNDQVANLIKDNMSSLGDQLKTGGLQLSSSSVSVVNEPTPVQAFAQPSQDSPQQDGAQSGGQNSASQDEANRRQKKQNSDADLFKGFMARNL